MKQPFAARAQAPKEWFTIQAKAAVDDEPRTADVRIYEQIGENWWGEGISAKSFAEQIAALDVDQINLYLNSPGGLAWDGVTIMNALRRHNARVEVTVDGLAASAASVIAMAGDRIVMNRGSQMMIHDAWGLAIGNAGDMQDTAGVLGKLSDSIADTYAARAGQDRTHWRDLMQAESWFTAEEAVTAGLADEWVDAPAKTIAEGDPAPGDPAARFDLSMFAYAGRAKSPAPRIEALKPPSSSEPGEPNRKESVVANDDFKAGIQKRLGVTDAEASDETLLAALDQALQEKAEPEPAKAEIPEGTTLIDSAVLADLQANAAQGVEARAEQNRTRREGIVNQAVNEGRIAPSSRASWRAQLDKDEEGTAKLLESLPKNTIPVTEIGHQDAEMSADEAEYVALFGDDGSKQEEASRG